MTLALISGPIIYYYGRLPFSEGVRLLRQTGPDLWTNVAPEKSSRLERSCRSRWPCEGTWLLEEECPYRLHLKVRRELWLLGDRKSLIAANTHLPPHSLHNAPEQNGFPRLVGTSPAHF